MREILGAVDQCSWTPCIGDLLIIKAGKMLVGAKNDYYELEIYCERCCLENFFVKGEIFVISF